MRPRLTTLLPAFALGLAALAWTPACAADARPVAHALRMTGALRIDGVLDEPDWSRAEAITDFRLLFAREGEAPSESTSVRVLMDEHRLVFGITCQSLLTPHASLSARDQIADDDHVAIHLDPDGDGRRAYVFAVNPYGVQLDGILLDDPDFTWDGVWEAEARRDSAGWSAEIAIPFKTMRFREGTRPWRLWIRRQLAARNEVASWPLWRQGRAGAIMLQAGDLTGLESVRGGHSLFVQPYAFAARTDARAFDGAGAATSWARSQRSDAGLDVQTDLGSALALNATVRPDFSQIESDALLIDLNQRFPLQYPEKRPFFLEGADLFSAPLDLVDTRRIADPRWGVKLTGNAAGNRVGALLVRDEGGASFAGSGFGSDADSRPGYFALGRVARELGEGRSLGLLAGAHTQDGLGDALTWDTGPDDARLPSGTRNGFLAADAAWKFGERWSWVGQFGWSATRLDSAHKDVPHELVGRSDGGIWVSRLRFLDRRNDVQFRVRNVGPQFRDELGFQERVGVRYEEIVATRHYDRAGGVLQRVNLNMDDFAIHDASGGVAYSMINPWLDFEARRNLVVSPGVEWVDEEWLGRHYHQERALLQIDDARWRPVTWHLQATLGDGIAYGADDATSFLAWTETWIGTATVRPANGWSSAVSVQRLRVAHRPGGGDVIGLWQYGVNTTAQFTRRLSVRIYPQYDSAARHLGVNALVSWVEHPGTVFYAGSNAGFDRIAALARTHVTARQYFVKASYRLEL